ncbi:MAG: hypothetical protein M3381_11000, partial [Actinomycetota bacterium]|nr:hypothetical protein [Actinomycetota bacterium]
MTSLLAPTGFGEPSPSTDPQLSLAIAAYLARFKGQSRLHTDSDLRVFLDWCAARDLDPLAAQRRDLELYVRWLQETRRYKPSTVSRRTSVIAGFYRTCVIDAVLEHSPAEYVRRPTVPPESPTLGLTHLQFEAMLTAGRESANRNDFALVAMLGLLGMRIFSDRHRCRRPRRRTRPPRPAGCRQRDPGRSGTAAARVGRAIDRAVDGRTTGPMLLNTRGDRMDRHAATRRLRRLGDVAGVRLGRHRCSIQSTRSDRHPTLPDSVTRPVH